MCVCGGGGREGEILQNCVREGVAEMQKGRNCRNGVGGGGMGFAELGRLNILFLKNNKLQLLKIQRDHSLFYGTTLFRKVYCAYCKLKKCDDGVSRTHENEISPSKSRV